MARAYDREVLLGTGAALSLGAALLEGAATDREVQSLPLCMFVLTLFCSRIVVVPHLLRCKRW